MKMVRKEVRNYNYLGNFLLHENLWAQKISWENAAFLVI
jgi:hypothetical protein